MMKDYFRYYFKRMEIIRNAYQAGTSIAIDKPIVLDFNYMLGDTIKEKYQTLLIEISYQTRKLADCSGEGQFFWMWTSPEISSLFEISKNFYPLDFITYDIIKDDIEEGSPYICGRFNVLEDKWYLVKDRSIPKQDIYCAVDSLFQNEPKSDVFKFTFENFII